MRIIVLSLKLPLPMTSSYVLIFSSFSSVFSNVHADTQLCIESLNVVQQPLKPDRFTGA